MRRNRLSLAEQLADELGRRILEGVWSTGDRIDSVSKLAEEFGVATATVREAIRLLQARNVVYVRHGSGTYVASPDEQNPGTPWRVNAADGIDYLEILEARAAIEAGLVKLATERATPSQIEAIRAALEELESLEFADPFSFAKADLRFHELVAEAASNETLSGLFADLRVPLRRLIVNVTHSEAGTGALDGPLSAHRQMLEAIIAHDSDMSLGALVEIQTPPIRYVQSMSPEQLAHVTSDSKNMP